MPRCHQGPQLHRCPQRPETRHCRFCTIRPKSAPNPGYAARSATGKYRTTPLSGLWQHAPYFHDGSAPDLLAVVNHYDQLFALNLSEAQKADLVEFLKSI